MRKMGKMRKMRRIMTGVLSLVLVLCMMGCGKTEETGKQVDLQTLQEKMLGADTTLPEMKVIKSGEEQDELNFTTLTDIEYERVAAYFYACSKKGSAEEIFVIQMKDKSDAADFLSSLNERVEKRIGTLQQYSPEQVEMAENAVVVREGNYVALIISEKCGLVQQVFKEMCGGE